MRARIKLSRREVKALRRALKIQLRVGREKKYEVWIGDGEVHNSDDGDDIDGLQVEDEDVLWPETIPAKVKFYVEEKPTCS